VLAEVCRRDLVPALWLPPLAERALREHLRRRMHLVRLRASAMNRIFGLLTQWSLRISLERLRAADAMELLADRGVDQTWRRSIAEALAVIDLLDERVAPLEREHVVRPFRRTPIRDDLVHRTRFGECSGPQRESSHSPPGSGRTSVLMLWCSGSRIADGRVSLLL
jgi:hypothetical protein